MSFISLFITVPNIGKSQWCSPPLWKCVVSPRRHKMALIKLSCNILDLLKHNSNYICMPVVPQLTIMRYFHHFSLATGRLRDWKNAIMLTETTERFAGLICCILNNNNPQNGSGAAAGSQKQNPLDGKTIPINCDTRQPRIIALPKSVVYWPAATAFSCHPWKRHRMDGFPSPASIRVDGRGQIVPCRVNQLPGGNIGDSVMTRTDQRQDITGPLMRAWVRLVHECVQVSVFVCNPIR